MFLKLVLCWFRNKIKIYTIRYMNFDKLLFILNDEKKNR